MRLRCALLFGVLTACVEPSDVVVVRNQCVVNDDCEKGAFCAINRAMCEREKTEAPYEVFLQVQPESSSGDPALVSRYTYRKLRVEKTINDLEVLVPAALKVRGRVHDTAGKPISAELTFTPMVMEDAPTTSRVVETMTTTNPEVRNVSVQLNPDTAYRVRVQPLGEASSLLPPMWTELSGSDDFLITYSAPEIVAGTLVDRTGKALQGQLVRLETEEGEVISSTDNVQAQGKFTLYALKSERAKPHRLVVSLNEDRPWTVTLRITQALLEPGATIVTPTPPPLVSYAGKVEGVSNNNAKPPAAPYADLVFVSTFPAETSTVVRSSERGWCLPRVTEVEGDILCRARVSTSANVTGDYAVDLLPGDYEVFVMPSIDTPDREKFTAAKILASVQRPSGDGQAGQNFPLSQAGLWLGVVQSAGRGKRLMPSVTVHARSLGQPPFRDPGTTEEVYELSSYTRSASSVTGDDGRWAMLLDRGFFDFYIEPLDHTGFAWTGLLNRRIASAPESEIDTIPIQAVSPVYVSGKVLRPTLEDDVMSAPLARARVEAYAVVTSISGQPRTVRVAYTTTDGNGAFRLPMPPRLQPLMDNVPTKR